MKKAAIAIIVMAFSAGTVSAIASENSMWKYGLNGAKGFNESTYSKITKNTNGTSSSNWRNGSMTGNGEMSVIESMAPDEDVIIFNNTKLVLGSNEIYDVADVAANLDSIRKTAADRSNPGQWQGWVRNYWNGIYGTPTGASGHISSSTKMYHPAAQLRIKNNKYSAADKYNRYTNFETAEIGSQWTNAEGTEYNTRTFVSREDGVAVTVIEVSDGEELDITLSVDNLMEMGIDSTAMINKGIEIAPESKEIVKADNAGYSIGQIVKYGDFNIKGNDTNADAYGAKGGYATAIRVISDGTIEQLEDDVHTSTIHRYFNTEDSSKTFEKEIITPQLRITGGSRVTLVSKVDLQIEGINSLAEVEAVYDAALSEIDAAVEKYSSVKTVKETDTSIEVTLNSNEDFMLIAAEYKENGELENVRMGKKTVNADGENVITVEKTAFSRVYFWDEKMKPHSLKSTESTGLYEMMLEPHTEIHGEAFSGNELELCITEEEKADRELTNTELNSKQQSETEINKAWLERLYYNARFGLICSSGYNTTRLGGIWVGNWLPDWSGDFTQDANVNLQVSSVNTTDNKIAAKAYIDYILRQVSDWEKNAKYVYGTDDAIMAGPRTDGDGNGTLYHTLAGYPFIYWNAGADWLIIPIYEHWQCYGNQKIAVGEDISLDELESVLDLTEADKERISKEGFDLEDDILTPLLIKLYNFWQGYTDERFYITSDGVMYLNDGTTMGDGDKFMFSPGYSPENVPNADGVGYNSSPSLAANTTMDISAAHDSMSMVKEFIKKGNITSITLDELESFEAKFPEYQYESDGALKEWAVPSYEEHYNHRHVSHTYGAWPGYEAQNDMVLREGLETALNMRYLFNVSDNAQAHGHLHNALVEARIKRVTEYERCLHTLVASNYEYAALMTSHNKKHSSAFCTDNAFGLGGVIVEGLLYSDSDTIEVLPSLIEDFSVGSITGLMSRANVKVEKIEWDSNRVCVNLMSNTNNNTVKLMCGEGWSDATVNGAKVSAEVDENGRKYIMVTSDTYDKAEVVFKRNETSDGTYYLKNDEMYLRAENHAEGSAVTDGEAQEWNITADAYGRYYVVNAVSGRVLTDSGCIRNGKYAWEINDNKITVNNKTYTLIKCNRVKTGCVADEIVIASTVDTENEINAGEAVAFKVARYIPGNAILNGVDWRVEAQDNSSLTETRFNGETLVIGSDALGKTLTVYAVSPDGSCESNKIALNIADVETKDIVIHNEDFAYGFGSYKLEDNGTVGTISGKTVLKYEDVNLSNLISVNFTRLNYYQKAKITLYYDLEESVDKEYYDDYAKDSGEGKGAASRRYMIDNVVISSDKIVAETVTAANGDTSVYSAVNTNITGVHDLYIVIETSGETWAGNYDYMTLKYKVDIETKIVECEALEYGFGNFKNETTNIGTINNTAVLKFEDVDFDGLASIDTVMTNDKYTAYVQFYRDLTEAEDKTLFTYDKDTTERDYRYRIEDVTIDEAKSISDKITINGSMPCSIAETDGIGDLYMVIRKVSGLFHRIKNFNSKKYIIFQSADKDQGSCKQFGLL